MLRIVFLLAAANGLEEQLEDKMEDKIEDEFLISDEAKLGEYQYNVQQLINKTFTVGFSLNQLEEYQMLKFISEAQPGLSHSIRNPIISLEEIYLNTKVKYLTGVEHWTPAEKISTCHVLVTTRNLKDINSLFYLILSSMYIPSAFLVVDRCAYVPTDADKTFITKTLNTPKLRPRDIYRSLILTKLLGLEVDLNALQHIYGRMDKDFKENMIITATFFRQDKKILKSFMENFDLSNMSQMFVEHMKVRRNEVFFDDIETTEIALETLLVMKEATGKNVFNSTVHKQIGNNLMTKMVIENSEELPLLSHDVKFMPDPVWMEMKRRRASLVVSCAYLLKMDKKAIYNKMINSGLTLPVKDKFSYSHGGQVQKKYAKFVGIEYFSQSDVLNEMEARVILRKAEILRNADAEETKEKPNENTIKQKKNIPDWEKLQKEVKDEL